MKTLAWLVVGEDPYLADEAVDQIVEDAGELERVHASGKDAPSSVIQLLRTPSFTGAPRVVVIKEAELLNAAAQTEYISYLSAPVDSSIAVFVSSKEVARLQTAIRKVGKVVQAKPSGRSDLLAWIRREALARGLKVVPEGIRTLVSSCGEDRSALLLALDQLTAEASEGILSTKAVLQLFPSPAHPKIFSFVEAAADRKLGVALAELEILAQHGESYQAVFWILQRQFRQLLTLAGARSSPTAAAKTLGVAPWKAEKLSRQAARFTPRDLYWIYGCFARADRKLKRSEEPPHLVLYRLVAQITQGHR